MEDPLLNPPAAAAPPDGAGGPPQQTKKTKKSESLTIRPEDEVRISQALANAAKKLSTGSIFSVKIDTGKSGVLGIGVKDLHDKLLAVSMLKRTSGQPGSGESAGIRLGDVIFGINFVPTREGSQTLLQIINQEAAKGKKTLHLQCWRCHQLCADKPPGSLFPRADDVIVQAHDKFRTKVFSDWERWNFIEILLGNMLDDLKFRAAAAKEGRLEGAAAASSEAAAGRTLISPLAGRSLRAATATSAPLDAGAVEQLALQKAERARQMRVIDLERNILQAKGLRAALCVRIVHTKQIKDTVVYVLRVEDVETGLQWVVHRRYRDFHALNEELADMSHFTRDVEFPQKRLSIRNSAKLVESRIVALEQYVRRVFHLLTLYATMDPMASRSLRRLQTFLGVDKYIDCIHPPLVDDQRHIELMAYRFLNDFSSPACQQCVRFVTNVDLDAMVTGGTEGYRPALAHLRQALNEVEQFVLQQHQQQMTQELADRKPGLNADQLHTFVRRCVRRQVEAAIFLPLRRTVFRIVYSFITEQAQKMQRAMASLQQATPHYFMVPPHAQSARLLPKAIKAFRDVIHAYLPADQGQLLLHAAAAVMELHTECVQAGMGTPSSSSSSSKEATNKARTVAAADALHTRLQGATRSASPLSSLFSPAGPKMVSDLPASSALGGSGASPFGDVDLSIECTNVKMTDQDGINSPTSQSPLPLPPQTAAFGPEGSRSRSSSGRVETTTTRDSREEFNVRISADASRRMSTSVLGNHSSTSHAIKPQSRLSFSGRDNSTGSSLVPNMTIDLAGAATLADPVREMFPSVETVPNTVRKGPDRRSLNLSFLGDLNDDDYENSRDSDADEGDDNCGSSSHEENKEAAEEDGSGGITADLSPSLIASPSSLLDMSAALSVPPPSDDPETLPTSPVATSSSSAVDGHTGEAAADTAEEEEAETEAEAEAEDGGGARLEEQLFSSLDEALDTSGFYDSIPQHSVVSADDFLPMFTFVVVQAALPQLLIVKELMTALVDDEETYGECGYYLATLEASTQHIVDLAEQFNSLDAFIAATKAAGAGAGTGTGAGAGAGAEGDGEDSDSDSSR